MNDLCPNCGEKQHNVTVIDDELFVFNCDYEWRYLHGNKVKHAVAAKNVPVEQYDVSYCGRGPRLWFDWFGTGDQEERDKLERLPECKLCINFLKNIAKRRKRN